MVAIPAARSILEMQRCLYSSYLTNFFSVIDEDSIIVCSLIWGEHPGDAHPEGVDACQVEYVFRRGDDLRGP